MWCVSIPLKSTTYLIFLKQLNKISHNMQKLHPHAPWQYSPDSFPSIWSSKIIAIHIYVGFNKFRTSTASETHAYCWWKKSGVHQLEVGSLAHYLQDFIHPRWLALGFLNHQQYLQKTEKSPSNTVVSKWHLQGVKNGTDAFQLWIEMLPNP